MNNPGIACELNRKECDPSCFCDTCQEYRKSIRMTNPDKQLYCMAFTYWSPQAKQWIGEKEYTHADSVEEARLIFFRSESERVMRTINIVGVAPVIGFFVTDKKGLELTV